MRLYSVALALMIAVNSALAHPLHTSLARVTVDAGGTINVSVRVFADDLAQASKAARHNTTGYVTSHFIIQNENGSKVALAGCGEKRVGDLVWVCLAGQTRAKSNTISLRSSLFFERYADQINVVRLTTMSGTSNLLFSSRDKPVHIGY